MTKQKVPNLEKEMKDYDLCPLTRKCNPDESKVENYCVINYQNCQKYINQESDYNSLMNMKALKEDEEWKKWLRKIRKRKW
jgi:hypothetical protein